MDALELLKNWPTWRKATAKMLFDSPAWRLAVVYDGEPCELVKRESAPSDLLAVELTFDGEASVLGIGDSPAFPDLHRLWSRRGELPSELLLALVEKECGALLQLLEDATEKLVAVTGVVPVAEPQGADLSFALRDGAEVPFSLVLTPAMLARLGRFENLDLEHPSIRGLSRLAQGVYAKLDVNVSKENLAVGDLLLLPDAAEAESTWLESVPDDGALRVCAPEEGELTFAQMADDSLPPVPDSETVQVLLGSKLFARGNVVPLGRQRAVRLSELLASTN